MRRLLFPAIALLLLAGGIGAWQFLRPLPTLPDRTADTSPPPTLSPPTPKPQPVTPAEAPDPALVQSYLNRLAGLLDSFPKRPNEALLHFKSDADLNAFLAKSGKRISLLGLNRTLRTARVHYDSLDDLLRDAGPAAEIGANYLVSIPQDPAARTVAAQLSALGFGPNAIAALGGTGDLSTWGRGVTVGVIDSGIASHPTFGSKVFSAIDLVNSGELSGHGTAVASLIAGLDGTAPGLAPGANLLSLRVAGADGLSDSFTLADAIQRAVEAGVQIINISMGSAGDSSLLRDAVVYAQQLGAVIVAAAGNEGLTQLSYPAAYPGVISVGGIEAGGNHLTFSNTGDSLQLTAPGYGINAAWTANQYVEFSGTSASAPLVSAAIATVMSQMGVPATTAAQLLVTYANDAGAPGPDPVYGAGVANVQRVLQSKTPGIYDAAVSGVVISGDTAIVTVQNRGTESLSGTKLTVTTAQGNQTFNLPALAPNTIQSVSVPINSAALTQPAGVSVQAQVTSGSKPDAHPADNGIQTQFQKPN